MDNIPTIGLGTWQNTKPEVCTNSVATALNIGYRHIDTAQYYGNEEAVGKGIIRSDVPREEIVVASKLHHEKSGLGYDEVIQGAKKSLDRLKTDYLDILYVHWPLGNYNVAQTIPAFDELRNNGVIDHVGVSNFSVNLIDEVRDHLDAPLFAHQAEMHPLLHQDELVVHAQENEYNFIAYSPLARGSVFDISEINKIADDHGVSAAQVSLSWIRSHNNVAAIPKASSDDHIRDNFGSLDLELSEREIDLIDNIDQQNRYVEREDAPWLE